MPDPKTLRDLEWDRISAAVLARCVGPAGTRGALALAATPEETREGLGELGEAWELAAAGELPPLDGGRDLRPIVARLERHGVLDAPALRDVRTTLAAARAVRRYLGQRRDRAPRLDRACSTDPSLDRLEELLARAVDLDGTLSSEASAELRTLRAECMALRNRIVGRLEELSLRHAAILQDRFHTLRDGRYVLPVRSDAHERFPGIVHGTSASGATIFVEPRSIVEIGNRFKMAQAEMEREEARILAALSDEVRTELAPLAAAGDALERLDLRFASARFGREVGAERVRFVDAPALRLVAARHPVLAVDGVKVVPNDLVVEAGGALVLSGPNAGGKSVALKTLGLAALMVRAGLPVTAGAGSECGFFSPILTDVGDQQSLARSLSTFSAHVRNLVDILGRARRGALVLLDEIATATDPTEGAALASAVVEALCDRGAALAVTTHYDALKVLAVRDPRMKNASVALDERTLEPTYRVLTGVPGASSALTVARRYGLPEALLARAEALLPEGARELEDVTRTLAAEWRAYEREIGLVQEERARLAEARAELEAELGRQRARDVGALSEEAERARAALRQARAELAERRAELRAAARVEGLTGVAARVESAAEEIRRHEPAAGAAEAPGRLVDEGAPGAVRVGERVFVPHLRAEAVVVEAPPRGRVRVVAGAIKLWVSLGELRAMRAEPPRIHRTERVPLGDAPLRALEGRSAENTVDVRGLRVDDALALVGTFVDRLYGASGSAGYVLHGHGSGALRDAVREHLRTLAPYVDLVRPGVGDEGGDAVTVFFLR